MPFSSMLLRHTVKPCFFYSIVGIKEERKKNFFYLTTHSRHFVYGYMVSDMLKDHSYSQRENWLPLLHGLFFFISSKGSFICIILQQDSTYHCLCYTSHGALTQWFIQHKWTLLQLSYISLFLSEDWSHIELFPASACGMKEGRKCFI